MRTQPTQAACANRGKQHQQGAALVVGLILLVVITLLAVAGMQNTVLQERMAGNMHDRNLAFQQAEAGLRAAARNQVPGSPDGSISFSPLDVEEWLDHLDPGDTEAHATHVELLSLVGEDSCPPGQVCDEEFGPAESVSAYRITSVGVGGTDQTRVVLQAVIRVTN
ncbi:PilX N-terminal domain-containing pilus assembly protein [Thioalkalivibrio sp. ALE20]|uniref:pilus assembly PilX family protein n=1 Tax=Thioalkalivibrio sp. ALE20 TaxID=545275 RepID=UPI0003663FD1|nr:PilX N-terminal domain-containing pilus assembly protein [Thioalkalivibrio sp. ALE20]